MRTRIWPSILILMASSAALGQVPGGCDAKVAEPVLLVLHDSSKPWTVPEMQWKGKGLCPK